MNAISKSHPLVRVVLSLLLFAFAATATAASVKEKRDEVRAESNDSLARLYKATPAAKKLIEQAAGYATFENFAMKILLAGGGKGKGIAVSNKNKQETFMEMLEVQAGLGMGVKKFALVFVFDTAEALDNFVNQGWELSSQATAAATAEGQGKAYAGAVSVSPGVWLYQLTKTGLAAEVTVKGSKYYKDGELN